MGRLGIFLVRLLNSTLYLAKIRQKKIIKVVRTLVRLYNLIQVPCIKTEVDLTKYFGKFRKYAEIYLCAGLFPYISDLVRSFFFVKRCDLVVLGCVCFFSFGYCPR